MDRIEETTVKKMKENKEKYIEEGQVFPPKGPDKNEISYTQYRKTSNRGLKNLNFPSFS